MEKFLFRSSDGEEKPCSALPKGRKDPLVGLHTWSADSDNQRDTSPACSRQRLVSAIAEPGPNLASNPRAREACASPLAIGDILACVDAFCERYPEKVDEKRIYLLGGSGGGHMALCTLAAAPQRWAMVSSWCPITDLAAWYHENPHYAPHIAACCGGEPGASPEVDREYYLRSPINLVDKLVAGRVYINHGRYDRSVPYTHSLRLYNALCQKGGETQFLNIFPGGHELRIEEAFAQLEAEAEGKELTS